MNDSWISVDERLPEQLKGRMFSDQVLVINMKSGWPSVMISEAHFYENETVWRGCHVTHWQPLPEPPKE